MPSMTDHPRSRGVYAADFAVKMVSAGSSPLARGLHHVFDLRHGHCVDHPRSRGVYSGTEDKETSLLGSSPLARGLLRRLVYAVPVDGIIPARAGFTSSRSLAARLFSDHPRSRGVYSRPVTVFTRHEGSSPLARGLRRRSPRLRARPGIIPARAGFTMTLSPMRWSARDHPRSRGVYRAGEVRDRLVEGSSPLARGLQVEGAGKRLGARIIPARAGFTQPHRLTSPTGPDHPRSRGVYQWENVSLPPAVGSSPLARGLQFSGPFRSRSFGIIPARAGFTPVKGGGHGDGQDHPRSRGVYTITPRRSRRPAGSSPLARGLHVFAGD